MDSFVKNFDTKTIVTIAVGVAVVWGIWCCLYEMESECATDHLVQTLLESVEREQKRENDAMDDKEREEGKDDYY